MFSLLSVILTLFLSVTEIVPDRERLYLGGDAYSAPMVYQRDNGGNWTAYNIGRDYLGSITHIASADGTPVAEYSYDPYIQSPDFTQNFNSYSYCLNNPLKYTDGSGDYSVYEGFDQETGEVKYVGITKRDPQIRIEEHLRSGTKRAALKYRIRY